MTDKQFKLLAMLLLCIIRMISAMGMLLFRVHNVYGDEGSYQSLKSFKDAQKDSTEVIRTIREEYNLN